MLSAIVSRCLLTSTCEYSASGAIACNSGACALLRMDLYVLVRVVKLDAHTLGWDRDRNSGSTRHCFVWIYVPCYSISTREENASLLNINKLQNFA